MSRTHCDACRRTLSDDAVVCPNCGTGDVHGWLGSIVVLVVCGIAVLLLAQSFFR